MTAAKPGVLAALLDAERVDSPELTGLAARAAQAGGRGMLDRLAFSLEGIVWPLRHDITLQGEQRRVPQSREHAGEGHFPAASPAARALRRLAGELPFPDGSLLGALRLLEACPPDVMAAVETGRPERDGVRAAAAAVDDGERQALAALDLLAWVARPPALAPVGAFAEAARSSAEPERLKLRARRALGALAVACAEQQAQLERVGRGGGARPERRGPVAVCMADDLIADVTHHQLVDLLRDRSALTDPGERAWRRLGLVVRLLLGSADGVLPAVELYEDARLAAKKRGEIWQSASTITDAYGGPERNGWTRALLAAMKLIEGESTTQSAEPRRAPVPEYLDGEYPKALLKARRALGFRPKLGQYDCWSRWHLRTTRKGHGSADPERLPCGATFAKHYRSRGGMTAAFAEAARLPGW